jgi:hypothetical protein
MFLLPVMATSPKGCLLKRQMCQTLLYFTPFPFKPAQFTFSSAVTFQLTGRLSTQFG